MSSGIYQYLNQRNKKKLEELAFLPGLAYLVSSKNFYRGILFLIAGFVSFFSFLATLFLYFFRRLDFKLSSYFLLSVCLCSLGFYLYLVFRTNKDLQENFRERERDRKALLFGSSLSSSYLLAYSSFLVLLLYVSSNNFFPKKQTPEEIKIEYLREFIENPSFIEAKKPKKDPKRLAKKDSIDAGRHKPKRVVQTGQNFSSRRATKKNSPKSKRYKKPLTPKKQKISKSPYRGNQKTGNKTRSKATNKITKKITNKEKIPKSPLSRSSSTKKSDKKSERSLKKPQTKSSAPSLGKSSASSLGGRVGNAAPNKYPDKPVSLAALASGGADYSAYKRDLNRKIYAVWLKKAKSGRSQFSTKLTFIIHKNGSLKKNSLVIVDSSGSSQDVLAARSSVVEASAYFRPLPEGSPRQIKVELDFSYSSQY